LNASNLSTGTVAIARLGSSGAPSGTTFLRGDNSWAVPTATPTPGGSDTQFQINASGSLSGTVNFTATNANVAGADATLTLGDAGASNSTHIIKSADMSSGAGYAARLEIRAGSSTGSNSGGGNSLNLFGGANSSSAAGQAGSVQIFGGASAHASGTGGDVILSPGAGVTGGLLRLNGGNGSTTGGAVQIRTASSGTPVQRLKILNNGAWAVGSLDTDVGTTGQALTSNGTGTAPTWQSISATLASTQVGFGNGSNLLSGSSNFTYASNVLSFTGAASTISFGTSAVAVNATISSVTSNSAGTSGTITIKTGDGTQSVSNSGGISISTGAGNTGAGSFSGNITLTTGTGTETAGIIDLVASASTSAGSYLRVSTNGTERLRILRNGAWSVGSNGTSTGTSGQVLTSAGSSAVPTWQTPSSIVNSTATITTSIAASGSEAVGLSINNSGGAANDAMSIRFTSGGSNRGYIMNHVGGDGDTTIQMRFATGLTTPTVKTVIDNTGNLWANTDNAMTLGKSGNRWSAVWSANGTIQTSDYRRKNSIADSVLGLDFINNLRPVSYKLNEGGVIQHPPVLDADKNVITPGYNEITPGSRTHWGLISQEVKAALPNGIDFAGWVQDDVNDPDSFQSLRYDEFISPIIKALQELSAKVTALEADVATLKNA